MSAGSTWPSKRRGAREKRMVFVSAWGPGRRDGHRQSADRGLREVPGQPDRRPVRYGPKVQDRRDPMSDRSVVREPDSCDTSRSPAWSNWCRLAPARLAAGRTRRRTVAASPAPFCSAVSAPPRLTSHIVKTVANTPSVLSISGLGTDRTAEPMSGPMSVCGWDGQMRLRTSQVAAHTDPAATGPCRRTLRAAGWPAARR